MTRAIPLTALPSDRARPAEPSGARHRARRDAGAADPALAEAALAALLARASGEPEVAWLARRGNESAAKERWNKAGELDPTLESATQSRMELLRAE